MLLQITSSQSHQTTTYSWTTERMAVSIGLTQHLCSTRWRPLIQKLSKTEISASPKNGRRHRGAIRVSNVLISSQIFWFESKLTQFYSGYLPQKLTNLPINESETLSQVRLQTRLTRITRLELEALGVIHRGGKCAGWERGSNLKPHPSSSLSYDAISELSLACWETTPKLPLKAAESSSDGPQTTLYGDRTSSLSVLVYW